MRTFAVLLILINSFSLSGFCQYFNPDDFDKHIWNRFDFRIHNASDLFDSCEIRERKIKSASLLQVYEGTEARDTLFIYYFDSTGKAVTQISFAPPSLDNEGDSYVRNEICNLNESIPRTKYWYTTINYTPYGVERKSYSSTSNEMLDSEFIITCNFGYGCLQTNERSEMITYRLEEGSCLIGRIVSIQIEEGYYATQFIINYYDSVIQ